MGDCGSQFIGFCLATAALRSGSSVGDFPADMIFPILVLCVPLFDTLFVTINRIRSGRPVWQGGRDHTSHRLVGFGLSESAAVAVLWGAGLAGGCLGFLICSAPSIR
jgi:UDP-GlcNAc:undecaprenyl-phosphate GlcNAc-1-phosphate transferase